jgi:lysophospholipase L1-like esterase
VSTTSPPVAPDVTPADAFTLTDRQVADLLRGAPWRRFAGVGDSVVEGVRSPAPGYRDLSWTDRIVAGLRAHQPDLVERNLGQRGLLTAAVRQQQLDPALTFRPDLAVVVAGGNDVFRDRFDTAAVEAELTTMVRELRAIGSDVVTVGLFDISQIDPAAPTAGLVHRRIRTLADLTGAVAERHGALHVDFSRHPAGVDPSIYSDDRLHLNARGHAVTAAEVIRRLSAALDERGLR